MSAETWDYYRQLQIESSPYLATARSREQVVAAQDAKERAKEYRLHHPSAFEIAYSHCTSTADDTWERRRARVLMYRHSPDYRLGETVDTFSVVLCDTGETLAHEDTKEDAESLAGYALMDRSRR